MEKREKIEIPAGIVLVNKPRGITSHDAVDAARKKLNIRKIGHSGTLDPLAEGLLILLVGKYTKLFPKFAEFDKEYVTVIKLGEQTDSGDAQGKIIRRADYQDIKPEEIKTAVKFFLGESYQIPPMVSAVRQGGQRLYKLARKGIEIERKPRGIIIYSIDILNIDMPFVRIYVKCSKGTYIRKLAEDIGERLGTFAHITEIKRTGIGPFKLNEAFELERIDESCLRKITS